MQAAERALAESPLNICGIPIKNLTMVEDRDAYYRIKHANTRAALMQVGCLLCWPAYFACCVVSWQGRPELSSSPMYTTCCSQLCSANSPGWVALQALQSIGGNANGQLGPDQLNNLAALLAMEGVTAEAVLGLLPQVGRAGL